MDPSVVVVKFTLTAADNCGGVQSVLGTMETKGLTHLAKQYTDP